MAIQVETVAVDGGAMNCYLVENTATRELIVVDPGMRADEIIAAINGRKPVAVLLTHAHYDHIGAVDAICRQYGSPLYMHEGDAAKLTDPEANVGAYFGRRVTAETKPTFVAEGQTLTLAHMRLQVLHTPGHSKGCCCYLLPENAGLLCGDTLFDHGYGRTDFADGDFAELTQSLRRLMRLHPRMIAYPGHGGATHVGRNEA